MNNYEKMSIYEDEMGQTTRTDKWSLKIYPHYLYIAEWG